MQKSSPYDPAYQEAIEIINKEWREEGASAEELEQDRQLAALFDMLNAPGPSAERRQLIARVLSSSRRLSSFPPAERVTAHSSLEAAKERTRRIVSALEEALADTQTPVADCILRQAGTLSSLSISEKQSHEGDNGAYKDLLLQERSLILSLLDKGATIRCMISPDILRERVHLTLPSRDWEKYIIEGYQQLIRVVSENLENPRLQIVCVPQLPRPNLLIVNECLMFIGRKRKEQPSYASTTLIYDPTVIRDEIEGFDNLFQDVASLITHTENLEARQYKEIKSWILHKLHMDMLEKPWTPK